MKYTEIDGKRYEVKDCGYCPFRDMGDDGWNAHCTHPLADQDPMARLEIDHDGIAEGCPLRDVQDQYHSMDEIIGKMFKVQKGKGILHEIKPCPFCGSTDIKEVYFDDTGEILEEWMMEDSNKESESEGREGYKSWEEFIEASACHFIVACGGCNAQVISEMNIKDAWAKWNRRV